MSIFKNDLYFIPNSGGRKTSDITKFNAFLIDFDCGRDENDNYYPLAYVKKYKQKQLQKLKDFEILPNAIIETRNGYHIYWFIKEEITSEQWQKIKNFLVEYFNVDKKVCSPAHQMRIPMVMRKFPTYLELEGTLKRKSVALCEQILTVNRSQLRGKIATLADNLMQSADEMLKVAFGLPRTA